MGLLDNFDRNHLRGLDSLLPIVDLLGGSPREIEGTIYARTLDGRVYVNVWSIAVGDSFKWSEGGRNAYQVPQEMSYYLYDRVSNGFLRLGRDWETSAKRLTELKRAKSASQAAVVDFADDVIAKQIAENKSKVKPNRVSELNWGAHVN